MGVCVDMACSSVWWSKPVKLTVLILFKCHKDQDKGLYFVTLVMCTQPTIGLLLDRLCQVNTSLNQYRFGNAGYSWHVRLLV